MFWLSFVFDNHRRLVWLLLLLIFFYEDACCRVLITVSSMANNLTSPLSISLWHSLLATSGPRSTIAYPVTSPPISEDAQTSVLQRVGECSVCSGNDDPQLYHFKINKFEGCKCRDKIQVNQTCCFARYCYIGA